MAHDESKALTMAEWQKRIDALRAEREAERREEIAKKYTTSGKQGKGQER